MRTADKLHMARRLVEWRDEWDEDREHANGRCSDLGFEIRHLIPSLIQALVDVDGNYERCPVCGGGDFDTAVGGFDSTYALIEVSCTGCGCGWYSRMVPEGEAQQ